MGVGMPHDKVQGRSLDHGAMQRGRGLSGIFFLASHAPAFSIQQVRRKE
jgi:hypothetical protein